MKFQIVFFISCVINIFCESSALIEVIPADEREKDNNQYLNSLQLIRKNGYPAEAHTVETTDGYLLEIHRIPHGKYNSAVKTTYKPPVFFQHGLLCSSVDFLYMGPNISLPFLLADLGYDVWLGNVRGNTYSRAHKTLSPYEKKFWNFSWHESAIYDLPAQIDFICNHTKHDKVIYIGHSMGTTMFFALTSTLPEYNKKIQVSLLMAPVAYVKYIKSFIIRSMIPISNEIDFVIHFFDNGALLPNSKAIEFFGKILCEKTSIEKRLCMNVIFLIAGSDPQDFDEDLMATMIGHFPAGYSIKALMHYAQLAKSGKFEQYDYGHAGNMKHYGTPSPPQYNLTKIKVPIYLYTGKNDYLSSEADVKTLVGHLSTLKSQRVVAYPKFNHLDFLIGRNVKKYVYDQLIKDMKKK